MPCRLCNGTAWPHCGWCGGTGFTLGREACRRARDMNEALRRAQLGAVGRDDS
jgi:hypothetical protein